MKNWKLVSGILSIILFVIVSLQSCGVGIANALAETGETSGTGGLMLAIFMLAGGIVSVVTRKGKKGGNIAVAILYGIASFLGFVSVGTYTDLNVWSTWCLICCIMPIMFNIENKMDEEKKKKLKFLKWLIVIVVAIFSLKISYSASDKNNNEDTKPEKQETSEESKNENVTLNVGDSKDVDGLKVSFISAQPYTGDMEYVDVKDGYELWEFEISFENDSDSDVGVSSYDFECYADNTKTDQSFYVDDNGLDVTLSGGRKTQGKVFFEIPQGTEHIELEYSVSAFNDKKIVFNAK